MEHRRTKIVQELDFGNIEDRRSAVFLQVFNYFSYLAVLHQVPRAGSGVVRIDSLRFLAGYRTR